jgi:hypothetical protein
MYITGNCTTRLSELKKFTHSTIFIDKYYSGGTLSNNGVDYTNSIESEIIIYYINGIKYSDIYSDNTTTIFGVTVQGYDSPDFINQNIVKLPNKETIISNPKIKNDVFIDRQQVSIFELNYKLEFIRKLVDLETYASGKYFKIIKN